MLVLYYTACFAFVVNAKTNQDNQGYQYLQPGSVMMGGYYGMPLFKYLNFPSINDEPIPAAQEDKFEDEKELVIEDSAVAPDEEKYIKEHSTLSPDGTDSIVKSNQTPIPEKINPKRAKSKPVTEDEDSLSSNFPFGSGNSSFFNTFFPIMVGGTSGVRRKTGDDQGSPGSATAIANSFSTGRGGVASSHATSFGNVYMSPSLRNRNDRIRKIYS